MARILINNKEKRRFVPYCVFVAVFRLRNSTNINNIKLTNENEKEKENRTRMNERFCQSNDSVLQSVDMLEKQFALMLPQINDKKKVSNINDIATINTNIMFHVNIYY